MRGRKEIILGDKKGRRRKKSGLRQKLVLTAIFIACASWVSWSLGTLNEQTREKQANVDITRIQKAARLFRADHGRCPDDLDELLNPPGDQQYLEDAMDPWGQTYRFLCPSRRDPGGVDVRSQGPNKTPYGGDDIASF